MDFLVNITLNILLIIIITLGGNIFYLTINKIIQIAEGQQETKIFKAKLKNFLGAGAFIGYFERIIIYVILTIGLEALTGLVLLISIKTIIRFPEIKQKELGQESKITAEQFIIGTLCSIIFILGLIFIKFN
ncbi:MAG: hypothetical protein ACK5HR_02055 [Mycoplasmatales bacterium]